LDQAFFVKNNSRLGCQIQLNDDIDGIVLRLAPEA
jgi:2Fe-2S ferredoxin